jgi:PAS domain S-box-containing protein
LHDQPPTADFAEYHWRSSPAAVPLPPPRAGAAPDDSELRLLADHLPTLCWIAGQDGYIFWYNRRWHDYCGSTAAEMEGWGWQSVHDPEVLPGVMARWTECIAAGAAFEMIFPLRGADGVFRPFLTRVTPLKDAGGNVLRWFGNNIDISAQRKTEAALAASEAYVRLLLNSSAEGFYAVARDGTTTLCNPAFLRMMGFAHENEAIGHKLHDVIHHTHPGGGHYDVTDCPIYNCAAHGAPAHVSDEYFYRVDGTPVPVEYWAKPIIVDGEHTGAICTFLDITERRRAEAAQRRVEDQLRALNADLERQVVARSTERGTIWQVSPHLLSVLDLRTGRFARVNPAWTAALGWTEEEMTGASYENFLHPDDVAASSRAWAGAQGGTAILNFENRYLDKSGAAHWLSWVAVPEQGFLYATARDITVEKEQAALVRVRTLERDRLWNVSADLLLVADYDGRPIRTNPSWGRILGYTGEELLAGMYDQIAHPDDMPELTAALAAMRETGKPAQFENRLRTRDGDWRVIAWTFSPDPDGEQLTGVGHDITGQREVEERLRQSQKMEAVGQLTGGIAHDFNNLLTGIGGSLEMLQSRIAQGRLDAVERYVTAAQGAVRRAAALTHRLLAFSRRQTLDPKSTDVNRLVAEMEDLVRRTVGPQIHIEVVGAGGLWPTLVDPNQLENALLNLCINARDAMPDGGRITIETANKWLDEKAAKERDLPPGQYVTLCVTDTGTGMTPAVIARAFDPFFTTKPLGEGTGLGLSMIYGFARQSGGQVRIYSELGEGTTMCLYLPRDQSGAPHEPAAHGAQGGAVQGDGEVVLIIDDEPTVRMLVGEVLGEFGYTALEAADGPTGLKMLQSPQKIDLLITDVGLPGGINGRQIVDAARLLRPALKILFITGYAENAVVGNGHLDPGMQVLTKPFAMDVLARRIRSILEG